MRDSRSLTTLPRNIWVVTATSFLTDISSEMIFNLIPLFLANVLGVGTAVIGLVDGVAETTASVMKFYAGALSDQAGQRKWLAVAGYAFSSIAKPFLLLFANAWGWVLGVGFSDRVGKGIRTADALVADSIGEENRRGLAFGVHRAGDTAGASSAWGSRLSSSGLGIRQAGAAHTPHLPGGSPGHVVRGVGGHRPCPRRGRRDPWQQEASIRWPG